MSPEFRRYLGKNKKLRIRRASISALASLLQDQKSVIDRVRQDTVSICENRSLQLSFITNTNGQASSEMRSIFDSHIGDEIFSFDDEIVNSFAYRNALKRLASKNKTTQQDAKPNEHHILDEPLIDLGGLSETHNGPRITSTVASDHQCLTPSKLFPHTACLSDTVTKDLISLLSSSVASPSQQRNERHADVASPLCGSESPNKSSAHQSDKNRDVEKVIGQLNKRTVNAIPTTATRREVFDAGSSDVSSILLEDESSSLQGEKRQGAELSKEQAAAEESHLVYPLPRVFSMSRNFKSYHGNVARVDLGSTQDKAEAPRDRAANRRRRRVERARKAISSSSPTLGAKSPDDGGQHGHESGAKLSGDEGIICDRLLVEHCGTKHEIDECERTSKEAVTDVELKPPRKTKRRHRRRDSTFERWAVGGILAAAALQHLEYSSSNRDTRSGLLKRKYRKRRVKDNCQDPGHDASLKNNSEAEDDEEFASKSSVKANPRLLETVENSIRRLTLPDLETPRQEQRKKQGRQTPDSSHRGFRASSVTSAGFSHEPSKLVSDLNASENPKPKRDENDADVCENAHLTTDIPHAVERIYSIPKDGTPIIIPTRKRRSSRDKGRGSGAFTHASQLPQTSPMIEYFEGGKGRDTQFKPGVHVKVTPSAARKINNMSEVTAPLTAANLQAHNLRGKGSP